MALFRKKKQKPDIDEQIFKPKKATIVNFLQLEDSSDEVLTNLASQIKEGIPQILNFDLLEIDDANKAIAFLSGVVYALEGEIFMFNDQKSFLFADKEVYDDGSMKELIEEIQGD